jgi:uncharacterized metal-binding protein YceD (DUF177 family)
MEAQKWTHHVAEIPDQGLDVARDATSEERAKLAAALDVTDFERLAVRYRLRHLGGERVAATGSLDAQVIQSCVVTLEPVTSELTEDFVVEFSPARSGTGPAGGTIAVDEPEVIDNGTFDMGPFIIDRLAVLIDPYPRQPGASLDHKDAEEPGPGGGGAFEALRRLRDKQ